MRILLAAAALAALAILPSAAAQPAHQTSLAAPQNLRGFLLRPDERVTHSFPRTPAFAWSPVSQARCYEFELATSRTFTENSLVWSNVRYTVNQRGSCQAFDAAQNDSVAPSTQTTAGKDAPKDQKSADAQSAQSTVVRPLRVPAVSVDVALPWFTGQPYALYAHVRAVTPNGPTKWSRAFAFNMRWPSVPEPLPSQPGLVRWSTVQGATGYQVWLLDVGKVFSTSTNVADEREYYTFHPATAWTSTVRWRVRAVRSLYGTIPNGLPAVSYGPWSGVFTSLNPAFAGGPLGLNTTISDKVSDRTSQKSHELMPAFTWRGGSTGLYRVYITTDRDCVNVVYRSSVVGSPAYAPRGTGPNKLPGSLEEIADVAAAPAGDSKGVLPFSTDEGAPTYSRDGFVFKTSELVAAAGSNAGTSADPSQVVTGARVDLPDTNFPSTRYYWTVVPVVPGKVDNKFAYVDTEVPQDACAAGRIQSFGKASEPVVISARGTPFVSGLSPFGRLLSARHSAPSVYGAPLVAWHPALGADSYEIQWSRQLYPWKAKGAKVTFATSAVLEGLTPGRWYYRVRGRNSNQLKKPQMAWSAPVRFGVAKPRFVVVSG